jgi:hypothetical protein
MVQITKKTKFAPNKFYEIDPYEETGRFIPKLKPMRYPYPEEEHRAIA